MPVQLERDLQRACLKHARERGWLALKVETIKNVGWPDVILVPPKSAQVHAILWVEFKREGTELSPIQVHVQRQLVERLQRVYTVRTLQQFRQILDIFQS